MEAIIFSDCFDPPQELIDFCDTIGLDIKYICWDNNDIRFNQDIVKFCKERLTPLWNEQVYKGKPNYKFRCGFSGAGYIRDIDTTKPWKICYNAVDSPIVKYVNVVIDKYGQLTINYLE